MNDSKLQQVQDFKYLDAWIASTSQDMHVRKGQAWKAINSLQKAGIQISHNRLRSIFFKHWSSQYFCMDQKHEF